MASRMERYYRSKSGNKRTTRNEDLYKSIYESSDYSNIEGITSIASTNEINITKLKEMLNKRENDLEDQTPSIVKREKTIEIPVVEEAEEESKTYDIRDILNQAKTERTEEDHKSRSLKNLSFDNLKQERPSEKVTYEELEKETKELKELLNTLSNSNLLKNLKDEELSLDIFDDLKPTGKTLAESTSLKPLLEEEKKKVEEDTEPHLDKSFFTSSLSFGEKDFQDFEDKKNMKIKKRKRIVIIVFLVLILVLAVALAVFFIK